MAREPIHRRVVTAGKISCARTLNLDHTRAEICQLAARERRGDCLLDRDDGQSV
jgi:hypothetical protein